VTVSPRWTHATAMAINSSLSRRGADKDGWPTRSTLRSIPRRLPRDHREGRPPQVIPHGNACKHATRGS
jgi:hypothetical protein